MGKLRLELIILTTNLIKTEAQHAAAVKVAELNCLNCYFRSLPPVSIMHWRDGTVRRAPGNYSGVLLWLRWWSDVCTLELLERYKPVLLRSTDNIAPTMFGVSYDSLSLSVPPGCPQLQVYIPIRSKKTSCWDFYFVDANFLCEKIGNMVEWSGTIITFPRYPSRVVYRCVVK